MYTTAAMTKIAIPTNTSILMAVAESKVLIDLPKIMGIRPTIPANIMIEMPLPSYGEA